MWFLRIAEELSEGLNIPVEESQFVLSPHILDCYFVERRSFFCELRPFFLRLELSRGTIFAAEFGHAVVDLKLVVK